MDYIIKKDARSTFVDHRHVRGREHNALLLVAILGISTTFLTVIISTRLSALSVQFYLITLTIILFLIMLNGRTLKAPRPTLNYAVECLKDEDPNTRRRAVKTLGNAKDAEGIEPLVDSLLHDKDKDVRLFSAFALGDIGNKRALGPLKYSYINDNDEDVRMCARFVYWRIRSEQRLAAGFTN